MKDRNRYGTYSQRKLPKEKRTIPLSGSLDDDSKYFRCWNCNFTCNKERDIVEHGDHGTGGVVPTFFAVDENLVDKDDTNIITIGGETIIVYGKHYYPNITKGCPFCGSTNYR